MNNDRLLTSLAKVEEDRLIQNLIAQADSRYILLKTKEDRKNFPNYTIDDSRLNTLAFYYLNLGCSFSENNEFDLASGPLERGSSILEFVHGEIENRISTSIYFGLIAALGYYSSFQYSKAFILIKLFNGDSTIFQLVSYFLKREYSELLVKVEAILADVEYSDDNLASENGQLNIEDRIYEVSIGRSLAQLVRFFQTGDGSLQESAIKSLLTIKEIASIRSDPGVWWVIRLLLIVANGMSVASFWHVLPDYFSLESNLIRSYIYSLVYQKPRGIYELFVTQRKSLAITINKENAGSVVSIPTSSGKTRIAELSILHTIENHPDSKVLYIAPYRSLAFEIESSLSNIFANSDISVSHLYGGSLFTKLDQMSYDESNVTIATPEKAKAMFRGNQTGLDDIKLIVLDEGHLIGPEERYIVNEIFLEEIRFFANKNHAKFLVLSAVLPNTKDLATWLSSSANHVFEHSWRPSDERFGTLEWTGDAVNLKWKSNEKELAPFNRNFIVSKNVPLKKGQRKQRVFPQSKNDAVAATAYKLRALGSVLIFVGLKKSVFTMAHCYLNCLQNPPDHNWPNESDWRTFEMACIEGDGKNSTWLELARKGILCHNSDLHSDIRLPLERLMRNGKPNVIIATSTLGQGVNLGVSSVIFSTFHQAGEPISVRDFWNIAGRAGRAFVDSEGKILVALDASDKSNGPSRRKITKNARAIEKYFNRAEISDANSGVLHLIRALKINAEKNDVSFDLMLELITENKTKEILNMMGDIEKYIDWMDDTILSLHNLHVKKDKLDDFAWVEGFFGKSLAFIQADKAQNIEREDVLNFFEARAKGLVNRIGKNKARWSSAIASGLPLASDLFVESKLSEVIEFVNTFHNSRQSFEDILKLLTEIESVLIGMPVLSDFESNSNNRDILKIRKGWLFGEPISILKNYQDGIKIITGYYSYILPWVLNGISKKLRSDANNDDATILELLSILVESGLPTLSAVRVYQVGIRARSAAKEISQVINSEIENSPLIQIKKQILQNKAKYKARLSPLSAEWIDILYHYSEKMDIEVSAIPDFIFREIHKETNVLIARRIDQRQYLISPDYKVMIEVTDSEIDFTSVCNVEGIFFEYDSLSTAWKMKVKNPFIMVT